MRENKSYFNAFDPEQNLLHISIPCWTLHFSGQTYQSKFNFIERAVLGLAKLGFSDPVKVAEKLCLPEDLVRLTWSLLRNRGFLSSKQTLEDFEREEQQNTETTSFILIQEGITGRVLPVALTKDTPNLYVEPSGKYSIGPVGQDQLFSFDWKVQRAEDELIQSVSMEDVQSVLQNLSESYDFGDFLPDYELQYKCRISQLELTLSQQFNLHCICRLDANHEQVLVSFFDKVQNVSHELSEALLKTPDYDLIKYRLLLRQYQIQSLMYSQSSKSPLEPTAALLGSGQAVGHEHAMGHEQDNGASNLVSSTQEIGIQSDQPSQSSLNSSDFGSTDNHAQPLTIQPTQTMQSMQSSQSNQSNLPMQNEDNPESLHNMLSSVTPPAANAAHAAPPISGAQVAAVPESLSAQQIQEAQAQTERMVRKAMQHKFGTPYPDLEKALCAINQTYRQLQIYHSDYKQGSLVAHYHALMQQCIFKMFEACELSLGYINQQAAIDTTGFNKAYFDRMVKILRLSMLPDPVILADVIRYKDPSVSAQVLSKLSQLSLEQLSLLLGEYCRRKHYILVSCANEAPEFRALQLNQENALSSPYARGSSAWGGAHNNTAYSNSDYAASDSGYASYANSYAGSANYAASDYYAEDEGWSDDGLEYFELERFKLQVLDLMQDPDVFRGLELAYEWCKELEDQFHSLSRIDLDYAGNLRIQLVRSMMLGLFDAVRNRGVIKQITANYPQLIGNLWALKKTRDAWAHGDIKAAPISLKTIECWHTMLLELFKSWSACLTDILKINLENAQDLQAKQNLDLNIKLSMLHYFDHFFIRDLGSDLGYELYAAESALQNAQIADKVERELPEYLYSLQYSGKPQSFVRLSSASSSVNGGVSQAAKSSINANQSLASSKYSPHSVQPQNAGAKQGSVSLQGSGQLQGSQGTTSTNAQVWGVNESTIKNDANTPYDTSNKQGANTKQGANDKVSANSLIPLASFFQLLFLYQLLRVNYDPQELLQSQSSMLNKLVLKLSLAGFVLPDGRLPYGLSRVDPSFIQKTILRRKNTLGSCLLVYLYVLPQAKLTTLAENWPRLVVDIDELIGLRQHGQGNTVDRQQAQRLKERLYTGVFKAFKDVVKSKEQKRW